VVGTFVGFAPAAAAVDYSFATPKRSKMVGVAAVPSWLAVAASSWLAFAVPGIDDHRLVATFGSLDLQRPAAVEA